MLLAVVQTPSNRAREVATRLPFAYRAYLELRREAGGIGDPALRAAVEAQILAPWLPPEAWAYGHLAEARKLLADPRLELPPAKSGDDLAAPGGNCEDGHHGYPGGLAVHTLATLKAAHGLQDDYREVYDVDLHPDVLTVAVLWHDSLKAATLPWRSNGSCGPEPRIAGAPAHHVLGLAAGILRHLPADSSTSSRRRDSLEPKRICGWVQAASVIAEGTKMACPARQTVEGFITVSGGFPYRHRARLVALCRTRSEGLGAFRRAEGLDGNDVLLFSRSP